MPKSERWQPVTVEPFSAWYEVSDLGRVRRVAGPVEGSDGKVRMLRGHRLTPWLARGQPMVRLCAEGSTRAFAVSRLVALAWLGQPPRSRTCAYHVNGDRTNNRPGNLEWRSPSSVQKRGRDHPQSGNGWKLTSEEVLQIRGLRRAGESAKHLGRCYGVSDTTIRLVCTGRIWRSV